MSRAYAPSILGVLNVSPESMVRESIATSPDEVRRRALELRKAGADWIDLGGRSITPDVPMISDAEEQERLRSALDVLRRERTSPSVDGIPADSISADAVSLDTVSVDTWSESTALFALEFGVGALNFTGGSIGRGLLDAVAARSALLFLTFMPYGDAYRMRGAAAVPVGIQAILDHLGPKVAAARSAGIQEIVIDPNLGIIHPSTDAATKIHQQLEVVWNLESLRQLECPILLYAARKPEPLARLMMASAVVHARADYIRTHTPAMIEHLLHVET